MADEQHSAEEWRDIPGYEGLYQASTHGRIRSLDRMKPHKSKGGLWFDHPRKGQLLAPYVHEKGYFLVKLSDTRTGRRSRSFRVHRLIGETFIPNPLCKPEVAHNDGCRTNNAVWNLRWATRKENMADIPIHRAQAKRLG
jgi:hypothetical protein